MALPVSLQNMLTMSNPRWGGRGATPQYYGAATYGAAAGMGARSFDIKQYERKMAMAQQELDELIKERDRRFQLSKDQQTLNLLGQGYGTPAQQQATIKDITGYSLNAPGQMYDPMQNPPYYQQQGGRMPSYMPSGTLGGYIKGTTIRLGPQYTAQPGRTYMPGHINLGRKQGDFNPMQAHRQFFGYGRR